MPGKRVKKNKYAILLKAAVILFVAILSAIELPNLWTGDSGFAFYAFDVGQADAFLFHLPDGENILIDAGTRSAGPGLVSRLKRLGVRKIDIVVATHPHEDHIGGMAHILRAFPVGKFWDSGYNHGSDVQRDMLSVLRGRKIRFERPKAGFKETLGGAVIEVLAPVKAMRGSESDANNNSIVLRVVYGDVAFLMTGDMENAERRSVGRFPRATVLKLAHHGSANGTDEKMLKEVSPDAVILTYGRGNSYGHPHGVVVALIRKFGLRSYATADGEIKITTDGRTLKVRQ
ncbi:MAG: MBL fold metallo-hydrolase [Synergistaceae bacterium]|jgi:competence protein ComEC|nr:MBL fold metallo-hydrolase [Synergistaceae bacterium]